MSLSGTTDAGVAAVSELIGQDLEPTTRSWTVTDCLLYAVGVGAGSVNPTAELNLTTENSEQVTLQTVPTFGIVLSGGGNNIFEAMGARGEDVLLMWEHIALIAPIPVQGIVRTSRQITDVTPHRRGRVVEMVAEARLDDCQAPLYRTTSRTLVRDRKDAQRDSATRPPAGSDTSKSHDKPTAALKFRIPPNQGLLYRLSAGRNPLHSDPAVSRRAGFEAPILHGRCTLGFATRLLITQACGGDAAALTSVGARMTAPVWPGDELTLQIWEGAVGGGNFRVRRRRDNAVVLDEGVYECKI